MIGVPSSNPSWEAHSAGTVHKAEVRRPIRVLLSGPDLSEPRGGIQTYVQSIIQGFSSVKGINIEFFALTPGLHKAERWAQKIYRSLATVGPFCRRLRYCDVVHLNSSFDNRSIARDLSYLLLSLIWRKRIILMTHGGNPCNVIWFRLWPSHVLARALLRRCEAILVLSKFQGEMLQRHCGPLRHMQQVPNFVDVGYLRSSGNVKNRKVRFLYLGRLNVDKGLQEIIAATRHLAASGHDFDLRIYGSGPEEMHIREAISKPPLSDRVHYGGVVHGQAKADVLEWADVLLLPSYHNEGFPFSILEAFSAGMPLISTAVGAIGEVVIDGELGLIVPPRDPMALASAMLRVMADRDLLERMGSTARKTVEREYSHDAMRALYHTLYMRGAPG